MIEAVKNFFKGGFEEIDEVLVKPFLRLSFYQKCFWIILAGIVLYLPYLNTFNATHDEQYTMLMCRFNVFDMIKTISVEDGHPPFSYLYAKLWIEAFGGDIHNILALRFATLFVFLMTAMLGVFPLKRLMGQKVALLWICLVFVLPSSFYLAMNMRMYPLAVFLIAGEFMYAMLFVYKKQKGDLFLFSLFTLVALYTHYYCAILSAVIWFIVLIDLWRARKWRDMIHFLISGFVVAVLFAPWLGAFVLQYQNMKETWYPGEKHTIWAINGAFFSYRYIVQNYYLFCVGFGILCWLLVWEFLLDTKKDKEEHMIVKRATMVFWSIYLIALMLSIFLRPNLAAIYLVIPVGLFYIGIAVTVLHFKKFRKIFLTLFVPVFVMGYSENYLKVHDNAYKNMQQFIAENIPQNSLILYNYTRAQLPIMFYAPQVDRYYVPMKKYLVLLQDEVIAEKENLKNIDKYDKIYHLSSLWNLVEFSDCKAQFTSQYDDISLCFKEMDKQKALSLIKAKQGIRELSFHKTSLW